MDYSDGPKNEMIDNESINRVFYEICGSRFPVEDFKDYCKKERTFSEIREAVRLLFILMNALGYHRNKIEKRTKFTYKAFYPLEVVFMMLIISVMRQNVTILLPVIMHCHRRRWKFIVILDAKPMSSIVKRKHLILPYLWQCYVRKQLLHKTFVILYRFVHCNHMWKVLLSYFKKFVLREK